MPSGDINHGLPSCKRGRLERLWDRAQKYPAPAPLAGLLYLLALHRA
jgi:hypothetical protein